MTLSDYISCWDAVTCYRKIADVISNKQFKQLGKYVHVAQNTIKDKLENKNDNFFKIRPAIEAVRENSMAMETEPVHSIDEQIIPAETKQSGIHHYKSKKPKKWGFKMLVRAGQSGMMYDFFLYAGKDSANKTDCFA